jgi:sensor histidine kinase YesM
MKNTLDLPQQKTLMASPKTNKVRSYFKNEIVPFVKANGIWIVLGLTMLSLIHTYWFFVSEYTKEEYLKKSLGLFNRKIVNNRTAYIAGNNLSRSFFNIGYWLGQLLKSKSGIFSLLGLTYLLSEFNYQVLFKNLFVEEGRKGKFFYVIILVFFYFFIYLILNSIFGKKLEPLGIHIFLTNFWIIAMLVYSYVTYASESYLKLRELALQKTKAELVALKAQINPHFLFNVLNNLYGQAIVEDSPKTAAGIERLSRIMRHVVEETKTERSPIEKELKFVEDFIELQKMRIPDLPNIRIQTEIFWDMEAAVIAPLLVIPFIENAFKYGISVSQNSFFEMDLRIENKILTFFAKNSIIKKIDTLEMGTGTGLENTKRRLELYYPNRHSLSMNAENDVFEVKMQVKL